MFPVCTPVKCVSDGAKKKSGNDGREEAILGDTRRQTFSYCSCGVGQTR